MPHVELPQAEFKIVVLGDSHTGKTSLVLRFVEGYYREDRDPTIGAFFLTKRVTVDSITCKLLLWDTAGSKQFERLAATYYKDAAAAIFTFDVTQPATLLRVSRWIEEVKKKTATRTMVFVIAACKCDLPASPGLMEEGRRLATQHKAEFIETSAKDDFGTAETFSRTAQRVLSCQREAVNGLLPPIPVTVGGGVLVENSAPVNTSTVSTEDTVLEEEQVKTKRTKKQTETKNAAVCEGSLLVCGSDDRSCTIM